MDLGEVLDSETSKLSKTVLLKLVEYIMVNDSQSQPLNWPVPLNIVTKDERPNVASLVDKLEEHGILEGKRKKKFSSIESFTNFKTYMLTKFALKTLMVKGIPVDEKPEMVAISCDGNSHGGGGTNSNFSLTFLLKFHSKWHLIGGMLYTKEASLVSCEEIRQNVQSCTNQFIEFARTHGWQKIKCLLVFESNSGEHFVTELLAICNQLLQNHFTTETPYCSKHPTCRTVKMQKGTLKNYFESVSQEEITIQPKPMLIRCNEEQGSIMFNKSIEELIYWNVYKKALMCSDDIADCIGMAIYHSKQPSNVMCDETRVLLRKRSLHQCDFELNEANRILLRLALITEDEESKELIESLARILEKCSCHH